MPFRCDVCGWIVDDSHKNDIGDGVKRCDTCFEEFKDNKGDKE